MNFNPISSISFHPQSLFNLMNKARKVTVPLSFVYLKFANDFWPSSQIQELRQILNSITYPLISEDSDTINDLAQTSDSVNATAFSSPDTPFEQEPNPNLLESSKVDPANASQPSLPTIMKFFGTVAGGVTKIKGIWPLIPPFLYELINSEEKHLQNIKVEITATKKKIYQIEFGKMNGQGAAIALEVAAGKPIKLMHDKDAANHMEGDINAVFPTTSIFTRIWKRQEPHTECIITVLDPGNPLLKDGQVTEIISLSEHEGFKIVHKDPTLIKNPFEPDYGSYDYFEQEENSEYATLSTVTVKLSNPMSLEETKRTETFSLPFSDDPKKSNNYYLDITQYQKL